MTGSTAMILDHIGFQVSDLAKTRAFLVDALKPLEIGVVAEGEGWAMIGRQGTPLFWCGACGPTSA